MILFALQNYLPDLKLVFKSVPLAMGALVVSTITLLISIAFNTDNISVDYLRLKELKAEELLNVASVNQFAFICHISISPMVKGHYDQRKNDKAIYLGFLICLCLYIVVGALGALAIYGRVPSVYKSSYNIIDYF